MLWIFAILLVLVCVGVLFLGIRRAPVSGAQATSDDAARAFFRDQLEGIDRDVENGRLSPDEAQAARAELAREVIRHERENPAQRTSAKGRLAVMAALPVIAALSLGLYGWIGRADLPAQPLADREPLQAGEQIDIATAVAQVEAQLEETPDDVRGWLVLAPIYMEQERFAEAANAWRRVLALEPATADRETNLAEALILANDGEADDEAMALLERAVAADPTHVRSRFYLAGELTRRGDFEQAVATWQQLLALATGEEAWIDTARSGLVAAQAGLEGETLGESEPDATTQVMIRGMVEALAADLAQNGGSASDWMQLVRSRRQLDGDAAAIEDLERGLAALSGQDRQVLEDFADELGLVTE